jgi:Zn-dependent M28 family amino/carboxypeptidase
MTFSTGAIRFGSELIAFDDLRARSRTESLTDDAGQFYVVVQNGRLFQQHHPEVPVIHDRGRFLLVRLGADRAERLRVESETCFGLFPATADQVVFEERSASSGRRAPTALERSRVDEVSRDEVKANLEMLTSFFTRNSTSQQFTAVSARVGERAEALGYQTQLQPISVNGRPSRNVIADRSGTGANDRGLVIVSAHLDSINLQDGEAASAPGADDNGSGSAGLLEIARVFQDHEGANDLRLIWFGGEEQGLFGSKQYVAGLPAAQRARIRSVVNMDMIGCRNSDQSSVLIEGAAVSQRVIDGLAASAADHTGLAVEISLNPFASDHVPFINAGLPAVLTIEGADSTNTRVHSANDRIETVDFDFACEILRMNVGFIAAEREQVA